VLAQLQVGHVLGVTGRGWCRSALLRNYVAGHWAPSRL